MLCSVITQFLGALGPFELNLVKISVYIMFALSFYWSGKASSHDESFREGFINGIQYYVTVWEKMQIGGIHTKQRFTANAELKNAVLSEDGLILRHNTVEPKQGDDTFGGMKINDFNRNAN